MGSDDSDRVHTRYPDGVLCRNYLFRSETNPSACSIHPGWIPGEEGYLRERYPLLGDFQVEWVQRIVAWYEPDVPLLLIRVRIHDAYRIYVYENIAITMADYSAWLKETKK